MLDAELGRVARAIRHRLKWRQDDVARRAGVHRSTVAILERGGAGELRLDLVRRILDGLGARLELRPLWHGPQLDRLLDERHAMLAAAWKHRLESWGWEVRVEVSYSRFGERGRIDLFGWYAPLHALLVTEIKTDMVDAQGLFGPLDAKARLARAIAVDLGWRDASIVMPMLLFSDDSTVRRRVARLAPLFGQFDLRGRAAVSWLRSPSLVAAPLTRQPRGLLIFSDLAYVGDSRVNSVGRERVRVRRGGLSVESGPAVAARAVRHG